MFELNEKGLYHTPISGSETKFLCGPIRLLAITRGDDGTSNYGMLLEWINLDNNRVRKLIPRKHVINEQGKILKEILIDAGLSVSSRKGVWELIISYLNNLDVKVRLTSSSQTGWVNGGFVTPSWCVSTSNEQVIYSGKKSTSFLTSTGTLSSWQREVGSLCINNPMLAFTVCSGLCAPLLHWLNWPSFGVHLFGKSKIAKTTILILAASLYSGTSYYYSWRATSNGLEATAVEHNDLLLCLDELHQVDPEDVDQSIYTLANGMSKIRSSRKGAQLDTKLWRLMFLSTGEMGLQEKLASIQKGVKAGQEIRFLEVPAQRTFGAYDDLQGHNSMNDFSESIWKGVKENHGTVMPEWIKYLTEINDLPALLMRHIHELRSKWEITRENNHGNQVIEASKRFALHGVSGELAISAGLLPWPQGLAEHAAKVAFDAWLEVRGSSDDSEDEKLIKQLPTALKRWRTKLLVEGQALNDNNGYVIDDKGRPAWLITREAFAKGLNIQYKQQIASNARFMVEKHWMVTNEDRGLFKKVIKGGPKGGRYYKILPQNIVADLALDETLSRAPFPI